MSCFECYNPVLQYTARELNRCLQCNRRLSHCRIVGSRELKQTHSVKPSGLYLFGCDDTKFGKRVGGNLNRWAWHDRGATFLTTCDAVTCDDSEVWDEWGHRFGKALHLICSYVDDLSWYDASSSAHSFNSQWSMVWLHAHLKHVMCCYINQNTLASSNSTSPTTKHSTTTQDPHHLLPSLIHIITPRSLLLHAREHCHIT
jgi:hypothetical protein